MSFDVIAPPSRACYQWRKSGGHMKQHVSGIDYVRFFAALLVGLFHMGYWTRVYPEGMIARVSGLAGTAPILPLFSSAGWVGVEVFFVISGLVISFSAEKASPHQFVIGRALRLFPAIWIVAPFSAVSLWYFAGTHINELVAPLFKSLIIWPSPSWIDSVYWTLGIEVFFYGAIFILIALDRRPMIEPLGCALIAVSAAFWTVWIIIHPANWYESRLLDLLLVHHGHLFGLGILIRSIWRGGITLPRFIFVALAIGTAILQISARGTFEAAKIGAQSSSHMAFAIWLFAMAAVVVALYFPFNSSFARALGLATYPLYIIHNVVGGAILGVIERTGVPSLLAVVLALVVCSAASVGVALWLEPIVRVALTRLLHAPKSWISLTPPAG